jgi:hypothetical protein
MENTEMEKKRNKFTHILSDRKTKSFIRFVYVIPFILCMYMLTYFLLEKYFKEIAFFLVVLGLEPR